MSFDIQDIKRRRSFSNLDAYADLIRTTEVSAIEQDQIDKAIRLFGSNPKDQAIGLAAMLVAGAQMFLPKEAGGTEKTSMRGQGGRPRKAKTTGDMAMTMPDSA